jgi:uncharacterized protein YkwD
MKALRKLAMAATVLAVLVSAPASSTAAPADPSERMMKAINDLRAKHGLRPLRNAPALDRTATGWARHLMRSDSFAHGSSYLRAGFRQAGEILAYTHGWKGNPRPALRMWLRSSGHRSLLLNPSYRYAGAGPARGYFRGATTIWVVHFGAH